MRDSNVFTRPDAQLVQLVVDLGYCNPFVRQRIELEQTALGTQFDAYLADWNVRAGNSSDHPNLTNVIERSRRLLEQARTSFGKLASRPSDTEVQLYCELVLFVAYHDERKAIDQLIAGNQRTNKQQTVAVYRRVSNSVREHIKEIPGDAKVLEQMPHLFAGFVQLRRAFRNIFLFIVGSSQATSKLRAEVWQSIFTHDMRRYRRLLFDRMGDYATLIAGPSGTGKELIAQAIGRSRYIPFDAASGSFLDDADESFFAVNLSALSPTLIESELFGHQRGAFTGAVAERVGWLEASPRSGTVFLDEIGELDLAIQVKLLRVLQSREFSRLGETKSRQFQGKIIAATNRNLAAEMQQKRFREDLYYRLCSDIVDVPSLRQRLDEDPHELKELILHISQRLVGEEADAVANEVETVIVEQLGLDYAWPGNIRELEQCVRNVLIRKTYRQPQTEGVTANADQVERLTAAIRTFQLTADELVRRYCKIVYSQTGSYEATARQLGLDRRTVKAKVSTDEESESYQSSGS